MKRLILAVLLLLLPSHVFAITVVQATANHGTTTSYSLAFGSNNTGGNNIYVACSATGAGGTHFTISDSRNTYTLIDSQSQSNAQLETYKALNIGAGANTVTCALSGAAIISVAIMEVAATNTTTPIDAGPSNSGAITGAGASTVQPGSITNTSANEIFLTALSNFLPPSGDGIDSSYTIPTGCDTLYLAIAYKIVSSTGATNPTWTGGTYMYSQIVGWKAAAGAATATMPPRVY